MADIKFKKILKYSKHKTILNISIYSIYLGHNIRHGICEYNALI